MIVNALMRPFLVLARFLNGPMVDTRRTAESPLIALVLPRQASVRGRVGVAMAAYAEAVQAIATPVDIGVIDLAERGGEDFPMHLTADVALIRREQFFS